MTSKGCKPRDLKVVGPLFEGALVGVDEFVKSVMIRDWLELGFPVKREEIIVGFEGGLVVEVEEVSFELGLVEDEDDRG